MLLGENTSHIIDVSEMDEPPVGRVVEDLEAVQDRPQSPVFSGVGCGIIILSLAFAIILVRTARRLSTPRGRAEFVGYRAPNIVDCPDCEYKIEQHLLIRHLIVDHGYDAFDAGEVAGKVFSGTWKPKTRKMVQRTGFEPAKHYALGPHPSPFDHSGTSACSQRTRPPYFTISEVYRGDY